MNAGSIKQVWLLINLYAIITVIIASPEEYFLNSIITQLQQNHNSQFPSSKSYRSLSDELLGAYSRSDEDFQNTEAQESSDNSFNQQNPEYDQSQDQIFQQLYALQHQANFAAGNPQQLRVVNHGPFTQQPLQQVPIIGMQQFNVNGYLNLPSPAAPAEVTEPSQEVEPQNTDPDHYAQNDALQGANFDPQLLIQHLANLQNAEQPTDGLQHNHVPVPAYFFPNPDPSVNENTIDDPYHMALRPLEGQQVLETLPGKKIVAEPLFVAMAGFVGIAMIFMSAILFLPKILTPPPEASRIKGPQELVALTKLAVETIEGNDCSERIACEVGRAMRSMQVGSKPIKVLEVLLPAHIAKQLAQIRKAVANEKTCRLIQCKSVQAGEQPTKLVESKNAADLVKVETTTKGPGQKQKAKTDTPPTTTKLPKSSTKTPEIKPVDKKQQKNAEKKPIKEQDSKPIKEQDRKPIKEQDSKPTQSKDPDQKAAEKQVERKNQK